jgi:hypothetical protein
MAHDINPYVADPASANIGSRQVQGSGEDSRLAGRKIKPHPVIMVREPQPDPVIMDLEVPHEVQQKGG